MPDAVIHQINSSKGGVPKLPLESATVNHLGITVDSQAASPAVHGGPSRALCLYALEIIERFAAEGHDMAAGHAGENITTRGLDWSTVVPGARFRLGSDVEIEITSYTAPCKTNARWFTGGDFNHMNQKVNPGQSRLYAKVLRGGEIKPGDPIAVLGAIECSDVAPVLPVKDVAASIEYYTTVLGFNEDFRWGEPAIYGRVRRGDVTFDFNANEGAAAGFDASDVDAIYAELKAAGADIAVNLDVRPYGRKDFSVRDPDGNVISIGGDP